MSATKTRLELEQARIIADRLLRRLASHCLEIKIAGSIRRGKALVGDIELVCIPRWINHSDLFGEVVKVTSSLDGVLDDMIAAKHITRTVPPGWDVPPAWGERYKKFWLLASGQVAQVDLFITKSESWGAIYAIRTGPAAFSQVLVSYIKTDTIFKQERGALRLKATGEAVPVHTEREYFALVGLPYVEPRDRTVTALYNLISKARRNRA